MKIYTLDFYGTRRQSGNETILSTYSIKATSWDDAREEALKIINESEGRHYALVARLKQRPITFGLGIGNDGKYRIEWED